MGSGASSPHRDSAGAGPDEASVEVKVQWKGVGLVDVGLVAHDLTVEGLKRLIEKKTRGKPYGAERMQLWLDGVTLDDDRRTLYGVGCEGRATLDITDAQSDAHVPWSDGSFPAFDGSFSSLNSIKESSPPQGESSMRERSASAGANSSKSGSGRRGSSGGVGDPGGPGGLGGGKRRLSGSAKRARNVRVHVEVDGDAQKGEAASSNLTLHIDQESTVARLKSALEKQTGVVVAKQVLVLTSKDGTRDVELDDDKRTVFGSRIDEGAQLKLTTTRQRRLQLQQQAGLGGEGEGEGDRDFAEITRSAPSERSDRREESSKPAVDSDHEHEHEEEEEEELRPLLVRLYVQVEGKKGEIVLRVSQDLLVADLKEGLADTTRVPLRRMELLLLDDSAPGGGYTPLADDRRTCFGCFLTDGSQLLVRDQSVRRQRAPKIAASTPSNADTFEGAMKNKQATSPVSPQMRTRIASVGKAASVVGSADTFENARATSTASPATGGQSAMEPVAAAGGTSPKGDYWSRMDTMHDGSGRSLLDGEDEFEVLVEVNGKATVSVKVTPDLLLGDLQEKLFELSGIKVRNQSLADTAGGEMGNKVEIMTDARRSLYGYFLEEGSRLELKGKVSKRPKAASFASAANTATAASGKGAGAASKSR